MHHDAISQPLQAQFERIIPLSPPQIRRLVTLCVAVLLAGEVQLTRIARFLPHTSQQDSRVRWIQRLLQAHFLTAERVYQPVLQSVLSGYREHCWHLVIDRTALWSGCDLVTISLNYRKRAVPLVWQTVPFGGAPLSVYTQLVRQCVSLVPNATQVVLHGDTEFGGADMIRTLREVGWDFMLAQPQHVVCRFSPTHSPIPLTALPVPRSGTYQRRHIELFAQHWLGGLHLIAFYQPHYTKSGRCKRRWIYLVTSLPLSCSTRRLGRRRWGTEPFYRDYKSSGWHVNHSQLQHPQRREGLLVVLALLYLLCVSLGRTLCKGGQRRQVDAHPRRQLSLFRIGWDWLIHCLCRGQPIPFHFSLYS
jgi:hypothetical protein